MGMSSYGVSGIVAGLDRLLAKRSGGVERPVQAETRRERRQCKKSKAKTSVAYPFAVVKPGGAEGHVTLDDINARLLRRPRRPVRHPVGEYAYGPCVSPDGLGLSGKAVASLTRIQTRGRGTITIIRTKG
ncbi:hypothetical protein BHM03_00029027 [Ensete ventricosum]|nr:hypothetical protein BHM03_00029027 [Ensete ventricosum]